MKLHNFNIDCMIAGTRYYRKFIYAFGTFDFDTSDDQFMEIVDWCNENCMDEFTIVDTASSYIGEGVKDVTVFGFVEEADAVSFKLAWC